jgi:hypothetical protein
LLIVWSGPIPLTRMNEHPSASWKLKNSSWCQSTALN